MDKTLLFRLIIGLEFSSGKAYLVLVVGQRGQMGTTNGSGGLFRHGVAKHKAAFEAVCVTLQYAMDLREPIFGVVHHVGKRQQLPNRNNRKKPRRWLRRLCRKMP
jgi:hypothetical protein